MATAAAAASDQISYAPRVARQRVDSVDVLRGLVMVIMLLDHTRDFAHSAVLQFDPLDLARTHPLLFLTRWITHFCAPVFVFLAGTSAYLLRVRGRSARELSRFLLTRGIWLVVLEFVVVQRITWFSINPAWLGLAQVIWAIGISMIVLSALVYLPVRWVGAIGIAIIALHNLLDPIRVQGWEGPGSPVPSAMAKLWMVLHQGGMFPIAGFPSPIVFALYPVLPWIGVMAAGYAFGALYRMEPERRQRLLLRLGLGAIALFIALRATNFDPHLCTTEARHGYGDPLSWSAHVAVRPPTGLPGTQGAAAPACTERPLSAGYVVLSFINTQKYPPSLLYVLMTIGPALLLLRWLERRPLGAVTKRLAMFGRVPLFFYLLQWVTAHGLAILVGLALGQPVAWQFAVPWEKPGGDAARGLGVNLAGVYALWALGVLLLYPLCAWFARVKARRRDWWLSYL